MRETKFMMLMTWVVTGGRDLMTLHLVTQQRRCVCVCGGGVSTETSKTTLPTTLW